MGTHLSQARGSSTQVNVVTDQPLAGSSAIKANFEAKDGSLPMRAVPSSGMQGYGSNPQQTNSGPLKSN